ncbi:CoA-binding protein [Camelliibacillus cellulosilyticus]|uniref:CoA-binding protein n=1 Tax=Camelliibacillus cellulosilyticus TaxID=2174486 RepID=A0ABV9GKQ4_9BACL
MPVVNPSPEEIAGLLKTKKRIAVVGLSDDPSRTSYQVAKYLHENGYDIIPVNPTIREVFGIPAVSSLQDINGHVDIVNVFRRPEYLLDIAKEAVGIGADVFWAQLGLVNQDAYDYLKARGVTVVMDRCIKVEHMSAYA